MSLEDTVIKNEGGFIQRALKVLKNKGILFFLNKLLRLTLAVSKKFFKEDIPLQFIYAFSHKKEVIKTIQGSKMILRLNDRGISRELALHGYHEKNSTEEVKRILKEGMVTIEVGANIGYYALMEAKLVGENGYVYAFEPSPVNLEILKQNVELNGYSNIEIFQKALGASPGTADFFIAKRSNLSSFIKRDDMGDLYERMIKVEIVTLDEFLADRRVDFVRMDVEGFEKEVLDGMEYTLRSARAPQYFFIEVHSELLHRKKSSAKEIVDRMREAGYFVRKSFYRGRADISVVGTSEFLEHPYREKGYWETFFEKNH